MRLTMFSASRSLASIQHTITMDQHQYGNGFQNINFVRGVIILLTAITISAFHLKEKDEDYYLKKLSVQVVEGGKHFPIPPGSDNSLYNVNLLEGDIVQNKKMLKNAVSDHDHLWQYGAVVYKVDVNIGCPESPQCKILYKAMNHYHVKSCIRFKEWTGEKNYVHVFFNEQNSGACWSPVGKVGKGEQKLSLGQRCWYFGIVVHELAHSIGFWHEMNRPDRDNWINIYWNNILQGFRSAFEIQNSSTVDTLGESFDYKSIMMYDEYAFSKDGKSPTLQAKTNEEIGPIWKKSSLSESDIRRLHKLYQCTGNKPKTGFPYDVACTFDSHTCGFKNGPVAAWYWKLVNSTDGFVYTSYESAGTASANFTSVNFHPVDLHETNNTLGCIKFSYLLKGDKKNNASLKLSQIFLEKVTQLETNSDAKFELWKAENMTNGWSNTKIKFHVKRPFKLVFQSKFEEGASNSIIGLDNIKISYKPCNEEKTDFQSASTISVENTVSKKPKQESDETNEI